MSKIGSKLISTIFKSQRSKRQLLSAVTAVTLMCGIMPIMPQFETTAGAAGSGTERDPFQISSVGDFSYLSEETGRSKDTHDGIYYKLTADITITSNLQVGWNSTYYFGGHFDGNGHTITVTDWDNGSVSGSDFCNGIFGYVKGGSVTNLTVGGSMKFGSGNYQGAIVGYLSGGTVANCTSNVYITSTGSYVGGIAGYSSGEVSYCINNGGITSIGDYVGGIIGFNYGTVGSVSNSGSVTGDTYVGGVVGFDYSSVDATGLYNTGHVTGNNYVGGVVGRSAGSLSSGRNTGAVSGPASYTSDAYVGGIVGDARGSVLNFTNEGTVTAYTAKYVGGIAGSVDGTGATVSKCANKAQVSSSYSAGVVGGIVGFCDKSTVQSSYNQGTVSGTYSAGIAGESSSGYIKNSYNAGAVTGTYKSGIVRTNTNGGISNTYYLDTTATYGVGASTDTNAIAKTSAEFKSGEVAYDLQNRETSQTWEQVIGTDDYPSINTISTNKVYRAAFYNVGSTTNVLGYTYANRNKTFPVLTDSSTGSEYAGIGWSLTAGSTTAYNFSTSVTADISLYGYDNSTEGFIDGDGSDRDPYRIPDKETLEYLRDQVNSGITYNRVCFIIAADINLGGSASNPWTPIGDEEHPFSGILYGNTRTISGLYGRLFGYIDGATIQDLTVDGTGGIVAVAKSSTISDCTNKSNILSAENTGGVVGMANDSTIRNCINEGTVNCSKQSGGVGGYMSNCQLLNCTNNGIVYTDNTSSKRYYGGVFGVAISSTVKNCVNNGTIHAGAGGSTGGVIGYSLDSLVDSCANNGTIDGGTGSYVGGIIGYVRNTGNYSEDAVTNCTNTGAVSGSSYVGGVIGRVGDGDYAVAVSDCANSGTVSSTYNGAGGVVGYADAGSKIDSCLNKDAGKVSGNSYIGGIASLIEGNAAITNCANEAAVTGSSEYVGGIVGDTNGNVENSSNTGKVSGTGNVGSVAGIVETAGKVTNCYYLSGTASGSYGTSKTQAEYSSGSVAYLLQGTQSTQKWGQTIGTDSYPAPASDASKRVYRATFYSKDNSSTVVGYTYANSGKTYTALSVADTGWSSTSGSTTAYDFSTKVTGDISLYGYDNSASDFTGSGTEADPYLIPDKATLETLRDKVNSGTDYTGKYFKVTADIDLGTNSSSQWTPIAHQSSGTVFSGIFDGDGHTISGIYIGGANSDCGLFGKNSGTIKNLTVSGEIAVYQNAGGVAGYNSGAIENCTNKCKISSIPYERSGGIAGYNAGTIEHCINEGDIDVSSNYAGGIAGYSTGSVIRCINKAGVSGASYVGGIVGGYNGSSNAVNNSYNTGTIEGSGYVGAILGGGGYTFACYYLEGTAEYGNGSDGHYEANNNNAEPKTAEQFASGDVAYNLRDSSSIYWRQDIGTDKLPVLTDDESKTVYRATFYSKDNPSTVVGYTYANSGKTYTALSVKNTGWSLTSGSTTAYDFSTKVTGDISLYGYSSGLPGTGTAEDPYVISDEEGLEQLRELVESGEDIADKHFVLTDDIDLGTTAENPWTPIGDEEHPFTGILEGNGHTIKGLYIDTDADNQGLFGVVDGGTIKDVTVEGTVKGGDNVGGIAGKVTDGTVDNCVSNVEVTGGSNVGGLIGNAKNTTVTESENAGSVAGTGNSTGGIIGNGSSVAVTSSTNKGEVSSLGEDGSYGIVGGIVGNLTGRDSEVKDCTNEGTVTGDKNYIGGIAGYIQQGKVTDSTNKGEVSGTGENASSQYIGGVAGCVSGIGAVIDGCVNEEAVTGTGSNVGGIAGNVIANGAVTNSANKGAVTGGSNIGGVAGNVSNGTVSDSYSTGKITGDSNVGGVAGNTNNGTVTNSYYQTGTASGGIKGSDAANSAVAKTEEEFAAGEVAYLLQGDNESQSWGQNIGEDTTPSQTADAAKKVYRAAFYDTDNTTVLGYTYANSGKTFPALNDKLNWTLTAGSKEAYDFSTSVTNDISLYGYSSGLPGTGTAEDPYVISGKEGLEQLRELVESGEDIADKHFVLEDDIDLGTTAENPWTPIGDEEHPFTGILEGNGHTIGGIYIDTDADNQGLFGVVDGGTIKDVTVEGTVKGGDNVGGIAGKVTDGTIDNCVSNVEVEGDNNVGGIAGAVGENGTITNSTNNGDVIGTGENIGGIVGRNEGDISDNTNTGDVIGGQNVGGIAGENTETGTVTDNTNKGDVTGTGENVDGIIGKNDGKESGNANEGTVAKTRAVPTVTEPTANDITYDGEEHILITAGSTTGGTLYYSLNSGTYSEDASSIRGTEPGTYTVNYKVEGDENYYGTDVKTVTVTIKAVIADSDDLQHGYSNAAAPAAAASLTYTGEPQPLIVPGEVTSDTVVWVYKLEDGEYTTEIPTGTGAGTYQVSAALAYEEAGAYVVVGGECDLSVTVNKAEPDRSTIEIPTDLIIGPGGSLSDIELPDGWSWVDSDKELEPGGNIVPAIYTPEDENYSPIEQDLIVIVTKSDKSGEPDDVDDKSVDVTVETDPESGEDKIVIDLTEYEKEVTTGEIIVSIYDGDGRLIAAEVDVKTPTYKFDYTADASYVKIMCWSLKTLKPRKKVLYKAISGSGEIKTDTVIDFE